jgi:tetratricopeptide (TPR) repeat protein
MKTDTLIKAIIAIAVIFIVALSGLYIFYKDTPTSEFEKKSNVLSSLDAYNKNDFYKAEKYSKRVLRGDGKDIPALLALGSIWAQRGSLEFKEEEYGGKAIKIAEQVLAIDPENAEAYRLMGYANEIQNKFDEALSSYNKALEFSPDNPEIYNNIGHVYDLMGDVKNAKKSYIASSNFGGDTAGVHMSLGRTYVREKNIDKAIQEFEKALLLSSNVRVRSEILYTLGNLSLRKDNLIEARKYMESAVEIDSSFPLAIIGLGKIKFIQTKDMEDSSDVIKNLDEAFSHMEKAVLLNPNQTIGYLWMGRILLSIGKNNEAKAKFSKALSVVDKDITLLGDDRKKTKEVIVSELNNIPTPIVDVSINKGDDIFPGDSTGLAESISALFAPTAHALTFYISDWKEYTKLRYIKSRYAKPGHEVWVDGNTFGCNNGWTWVYTGGGSSPSCSDGIQNQNETGVDTGGVCGGGGGSPSCSDGIQNQNETGVDTGGVCGGGGSSCTNYSAGAWGACTGYDTQTGQGGTQTRGITSSTGACPSNSAPSSSRSCSVPFDFNLAKKSTTGGGGQGSLSIGSDYTIEAVFIGNSQSEVSSEAVISISPTFPQYPGMPNINFSVMNADPALPIGMQYIFSPTSLNSGQYTTGSAFSVNVPRTNSGDYFIKVKVEGGGISRIATVKLKVKLLNPTFKEI